MDRKKIKENLNKDVIFKGVEYKMTACIFRLKDNGTLYCQAELSDKTSRSILICRLEDVEEKSN